MSDDVTGSESSGVKKEAIVPKEDVNIVNSSDAPEEREKVRFWNIGIVALNDEQKIERIVSDLNNAAGDEIITRKILYNVIRLDDVELFENVFVKWQSCNSDDEQFERKFTEQLSEAFEELQMKNVPISDEMTCAVVEILIDFQYFNRNDKQEENTGDVKARVNMVCNKIDRLNSKYSDEHGGQEVDEEFIFLAGFVAQNIRILKRMLKSTYDQLPWEEIEFCLVAFIASETKRQELNFYYKLVLDKNRIMNHLVTFAVKLSSLRLNEIKDKKHFGNRTGVVEFIIENNPQFEGLYSDFEVIRDVYSLSRAERYIKLALEVDLDKNFELGKLVMERALQVLGECLKNTLDSPNLSDDIQNQLLHSAPRNLREIITLLRDSLSHIHFFGRKMQIEERNDLPFFKTLQSDITKIDNEIRDIINQKKIDVIQLLVSKVNKCNDLKDVRMLRRCFRNANLDEFDFCFKSSSDFKKIETLVGELRQKLGNCSADVDKLFDEIDNIIKNNVVVTAASDYDYKKLFLRIKNCIFKFTNMDIIRIMIQSIMATLTKVSIKRDLNGIEKLLREIDYKSSMMPNVNKDETIPLFYKIYCLILHDECAVKTIDEFKKKLEDKLDGRQNKKQEMVDKVIKKIENCFQTEKDKDLFRKRVDKLKAVNDAKQQLVDLFKRNQPVVKEKYDLLLEFSSFSLAQKADLNTLYESSNWKGCVEFLNRIRDGYKTFYDSISSQKENKKKDMAKIIKEFVGSLSKNEASCIDVMLKEEGNENERYFCARVEMLNTIVPLTTIHMSRAVLGTFKQDCQLQAAVEMIILDLMEMLEDASLLADDRLFLDRSSPVLIGKQLRNYLAHGDLLLDSMPLDPVFSLAHNAAKLITEGKQMIKSKGKLIGQTVAEDICNNRNRFDNASTFISIQTKMFLASQEGDADIMEQLVDFGADTKARNVSGLTALHLAAQRDRINVIESLLERNPGSVISNALCYSLLCTSAASGSINCVEHILKIPLLDMDQRQKQRLLRVTAENGHLQVMRVLQRQGLLANIDKDDLLQLLIQAALNEHADMMQLLINLASGEAEFSSKDYGEALFHAAFNGDLKSVDMLLNKMTTTDSAATLESSYTPLQIATINGHDNVVKALLLKGVDANGDSVDCQGVALKPLHLAAFYDHRPIIASLIDSGAFVDVRNNKGYTPLHLAAMNGHMGACQALLHRDATIDIKTLNEETPLLIAALSGHAEVVQFLLSRVALIDSKDVATLFCLAVIRDHTAAALVLLDHLPDFTKEEADFHLSPLCSLASVKGNVDVIAALLAKGATIKVGNCFPLHCAAFNGHSAVADLIVSQGAADVNIKDVNNLTALHIAALKGHLDFCRVLLLNQADVNVRDDSDNTPLHLAARRGHQEVVSLLLEKDADINAKNDHGHTPLHVAVQNDREESVDILVKNKTLDINAADNSGQTSLFVAAFHGYVDILLTLLTNKGTFPDLADDVRNTPLHLASFNGHKYAALALLKRGSNVNICNHKNQTPLHLATIHDHSDVCLLLLDNNATIDQIDNFGYTPLHQAAANGSCDVLTLLLDDDYLATLHGDAKVVQAQIDVRGGGNRTALHLAAWGGYGQVVSILLQKGATVDALDVANNTPLYIAIKMSHSDVTHFLIKNGASIHVSNRYRNTLLHAAVWTSQPELVRFLIERGLSVKDRTNYGLTPLHIAVEKGNVEIVGILLAKGAETNAITVKGHTPMDSAIKFGHLDIAHTLIANGAGVCTRFSHNMAPLHRAARSNNICVITTLLELGEDVNGKCFYDITALHLASEFGHFEFASMLLEMGASVDAETAGGATALHVAADMGHVHVCRLLLDKTAAIHAQDANKLTALHVAALKGHADIVQLLVERDADANIKDINGHTPFDMASEPSIAMLLTGIENPPSSK